MRRSEFSQLADYVFGPILAATYRRELILHAVGGVSADEAIASGVPVRQVWVALCEALDVPESQRWEIPPDDRPHVVIDPHYGIGA